MKFTVSDINIDERYGHVLWSLWYGHIQAKSEQAFSMQTQTSSSFRIRSYVVNHLFSK